MNLCLLCAVAAVALEANNPSLQIVEPREGQTIESFLTATLRWAPQDAAEQNDNKAASPSWEALELTVCPKAAADRPSVRVRLAADETSYQLALRPGTAYVWQVTPWANGKAQPDLGFRASFTTGQPRIDTTTDDNIRYKNPRQGAHFQYMDEIPHRDDEPLSPWYAVKKYTAKAAPTFEQIEKKLPEPVWDGHADALDAYWYCWKTLCEVWSYAPKDADHQAVANLIGLPTWGPWGSTMVWDTAFTTYFAKYAYHAYPFIEGFDNCYARQHENGFICRESDRENREVYVVFPLNLPLFAWAEWEYYRLSGDKERLERVFLPIVKHFEWWMIYQRRDNGTYWCHGLGEGMDDSPRRRLMHASIASTSVQALSALSLSKMASVIGRDDMADYFQQQHKEIGDLTNAKFWDAEHRIYNDVRENGKPITEPKDGGGICKHGFIFWPLLAEIAPPDRVAAMVAEASNPNTFYRGSGIASLSGDSEHFTGGAEGTGHYWHGAVWPPIQCMVQEGLRVNDRRDLARQFAERYYTAVIEAYVKQHDITENLAPDRPLAGGCGKFVGWGGVAPVANLIEYILGFDINVPDQRVVWHIDRTERHGLKNLWLGSFSADMLCQARTTAEAPCRLSVTNRGPFTLVVVTPRGKTEHKITPGDHEIVVE